MRNVIKRKEPLKYNTITDTDSYKFSHWVQYPKGTSRMMSYFEARGGEFDEATVFGLQYYLHMYLSERITHEMVDEAAIFAVKHGEPFNEKGWRYIVDHYNGKLPVTIRAIPEGTCVPVSNALMTIECDDPMCFWVVSWLETMLVRLWYPSSIAMASRESRKILNHYLQLTSDTPSADIPFKLHDFGARGVTTLEQSRVGGGAHLLSFLGSDTVEGIRWLNHYYDCDMAGFSIPASEHSTVSMHGPDGEYSMFLEYVDHYLTNREVPEGLPKLAACVSDTYNIFEAVRFWCRPEVRQKIKDSKGTLVIRPDSGDPITVLLEIFLIMEKELGDEVTNSQKGYKVLPPYLRVIQGDGIDRNSMREILEALMLKGWSATNIAFGSGGGLLQKVNRDTQKWAFKCCAAMVNGRWVDVRKNPVTDEGKRSKAGRLDLILVDSEGEQYETIPLNEGTIEHMNSAMNTVFDMGDILYHTTVAECRARMGM